MPSLHPAAASPAAAGELLARLDEALAAHPALTPLDEERFLETHVLYEGRSDQQGQILRWFADSVAPAVPEGRPYRVLSVGCGSGILDVPLARALAPRAEPLRYVGVDPNVAECQAFSARFAEADLPGVEVTVRPCLFEELRDPGPFDLVHIVHALYYVPSAAAFLEQARALLAPGGRLVVFHAPREEMNALAACFYDKQYGRPTLFADEVAELCRRRDWEHHRGRVDARLDVTPLADGDAELGLALRDFIVQVDSAALSPAVQKLVDGYLAAITERAPDGRAFIAHPVDVFALTN
ncbi:MAG: class I SAM-dependent methyltransferase [Myxococcota bacterium]